MMSDSTPLISVIIPHQAGSEILINCLEALDAACADITAVIGVGKQLGERGPRANE